MANRNGVVFHQDNPKPRTSLITRKQLLEMGWEVMLYLPYNSSIAETDYYSFRFLQNHLHGQHSIQKRLSKISDSDFCFENETFFERGIMELAGRCERSLKSMVNIS